MKNLIAGLRLFVAASSAFAGQYEAVAAKVQACKNYADTADVYWQLQKEGKRPNPFNDQWMEPIRQHIEDEIYNNNQDYPDQQSARRMGAYYCMDHTDRLTRDHNAGL
jgi:hypothetical protein